MLLQGAFPRWVGCLTPPAPVHRQGSARGFNACNGATNPSPPARGLISALGYRPPSAADSCSAWSWDRPGAQTCVLPGLGGCGGPGVAAAAELLQARLEKPRVGGSGWPGGRHRGKAAPHSAPDLFIFLRFFHILHLPKPQKAFLTSAPRQVNYVIFNY